MEVDNGDTKPDGAVVPAPTPKREAPKLLPPPPSDSSVGVVESAQDAEDDSKTAPPPTPGAKPSNAYTQISLHTPPILVSVKPEIKPIAPPPAAKVRCRLCTKTDRHLTTPASCTCKPDRCSICIDCLMCAGDIKLFNGWRTDLDKARKDIAVLRNENTTLRAELARLRLERIQAPIQQQPTPVAAIAAPPSDGAVQNIDVMMRGIDADTLFNFNIARLPPADVESFFGNQKPLSSAIYPVTTEAPMSIGPEHD